LAEVDLLLLPPPLFALPEDDCLVLRTLSDLLTCSVLELLAEGALEDPDDLCDDPL
jgi:hypothetical protein